MKIILKILIVGGLIFSLNGCTTTPTQNYLKKHPDTPARIKNSMLRGNVCIGMTEEQLIECVGQPLRILRDEGSNRETWVYKYSRFSYSSYGKKYYVTLKKSEVIRVETERNRTRRKHREAEAKAHRKHREAKKEYIKNHPERSRFIALMEKEKIVIGMNKQEVKFSWGEPRDINRTVTTYGVHEQWVYDSSYLYFEGDKLTSWQD
jgi:hypothetical protein